MKKFPLEGSRNPYARTIAKETTEEYRDCVLSDLNHLITLYIRVHEDKQLRMEKTDSSRHEELLELLRKGVETIVVEQLQHWEISPRTQQSLGIDIYWPSSRQQIAINRLVRMYRDYKWINSSPYETFMGIREDILTPHFETGFE